MDYNIYAVDLNQNIIDGWNIKGKNFKIHIQDELGYALEFGKHTLRIILPIAFL